MQIIDRLKEIVGLENVTDDPAVLETYSKDKSLSKPQMANCLVKAKSTEEVQQVVKIANEYKTPIVPCSSRVHFYGNAIPSPGGIILDLGKMNRILEIDETNKTVRVEPGVTWGTVQSEMKPYKLMALSPLLPHAGKSVLTSHLEREPMLIPKFEYGDNLLTMEVVLPDGEIFRTGSACVPGFPDKSLAKGLNPGGPGEITWSWLIQGAQGSMGVVTWAQVKAVPRPVIDKTFFIPFKRIDEAIKLIYAVQQRMLGSECLLLNNTNMAAILSQKWPDDFNHLRKVLPPWVVLFVLGGGWRRPEEKIEYEEDGLKEVAAELRIPFLPESLPDLPGIEREVPNILRNPWPSEKDYWKFAYKGDCQDLFFHTTLNRTPAFIDMINQICSNHCYCHEDIGFYIQPLEYSRACHFECNLFYNQSIREETEKISEMFSELAEKAFEMSAFYSRPYGPLARMVYDRAADYTIALKKVKKLFDPNNIMAPDRLCY